MEVAYLSQGKLFLKRNDAPPREVESHFAQGIADRAAKSQERLGWKNRGTGPGMPQGMLWNLGGGAAHDPTRRTTNIVSVARSADGELLYVLDTESTSGLFVYRTQNNEERRLIHRREFRPRHLARNPADGRLVCSVRMDDGTSRIAMMEADGSRLRELTEGDAIDEAPTWVPASPGAPAATQLVYQSAGVARNTQGHPVSVGPYAIMKLDLDRGSLDAIAEDHDTDFLLPQITADGSMLFIRRPYESCVRASPLRTLLDIVLFPFRLLRAVFHFLNFFSIMFAQKPLTSAGGPAGIEPPSQRFVMLYGRVIDAEKIARAAKSDSASLVPKTWELVHQTHDGKQSVLASSVASFDVCDNGGIVYTNGSTIFHRAPDGTTRTLCNAKLIESVIVTG